MRDFRHVAVVGAGTMGAAICQHFLMKGLKVCLVDVSAKGLSRGQSLIEQSLDEAVERRLLNQEGKAGVLTRLYATTDMQELATVDLVVEAVFEDLALKRDLFLQLENVVRPDCVLLSNTSSFRINDLAQGLRYPQRFLGAHYFYHAAKNKLIELVSGQATDRGLLADVESFYVALGKTPIRTEDAPGFAVNRFFVPWLNEAVRIYQEGLGSIQGIDEVACQVFGVGMGPFALMNATGVPIAQHAAEGLATTLGAFYEPAEALCRQVKRGEPWPLADRQLVNGGEEQPELIRERLLAATLGAAAALVSEGVCSATDTDLGARAGLRWPRGPFEMINALGVRRVADLVQALFTPWELPIPSVLVKNEEVIALDWVQTEEHGSTGLVIFNLPDRMNALGETVMAQLAGAFERLENRSDVERIFFCGKGKAFVAGADIRFFLTGIESGDLQSIQSFTEYGQSLFSRIARSSKMTCAYLDGMALGGGLELALACKSRVGTANTLLAFPETGIGIYPGLGGTQRSSRLLGKGVAKCLVATGQRVQAEQALALGLIDALIEPVRQFADLAALQMPVTQSGRKPMPEWQQAFADYHGEQDAAQLASPALAPFARELARKAPMALQTAMRLMDEGDALPLSEALALELQGLKAIFATADAKTGLQSVLDGTRPTFRGC